MIEQSTYENLWSILKRDKIVSITARRSLHPRIIKAVVKRKWMDMGFKLVIDPQVAVLSSSSKFAVLTLKLTISNKLDFRMMDMITEKDL